MTVGWLLANYLAITLVLWPVFTVGTALLLAPRGSVMAWVSGLFFALLLATAGVIVWPLVIVALFGVVLAKGASKARQTEN